MDPLSALDYKLLLAVPLIPLAGYLIQIFFGRHLPGKGGWLLTGGMFAVMCITVKMFLKQIGAHGGPSTFHLSAAEGGPTFEWLYRSAEKADGLNLVAGIQYDGLGAAMLAVVGVVSFFVHLFSMGYMKTDRRYHIFFANISLFTVAMLGLVLSDNMLFLFVFWEVMGLMSYLLIGHFAHDPDSPRIKQAAAACKKAFMTTRVGDTCLLFGMAMFYFWLPKDYNELLQPAVAAGGTFNFAEMWRMASEIVIANGGEYPAWMTVAGLFLFGGTVGKSAQFPLHIWLPDAMEGPTPVSAMIHAATMVAAGVFLLGRSFPLLSPDVLQVVVVFGSFTAFFAATIGCTVNDIKGVLAYSTISQLGFMVASIGCGGLGLIAGLFHMVTHAFFKACLFLSAGSVIHGCHHEQDMRKMGGLRKKMPITFICMLICTLAISGMPLFSGFYSKDRIIQAAAELTMQGNVVGWFAVIALPLAALMTTFYMFRLIFMTFFGEPRDHHIHDHAHESPWPMTVSLACLATGGLFVGKFWLIDITDVAGSETWFTSMITFESLYPGIDLYKTNMLAVGQMMAHDAVHLDHLQHTAHTIAVVVSLSVLALGFFLALWMYWKKDKGKLNPENVTTKLGPVYTFVLNKWYVDEAVNGTLIAGTNVLARSLKWVDETLVDGFVLGVGRVSKSMAFMQAWIDKNIVDGFVNLIGSTTHAFGYMVRLLQTGRIQQYITFAVAGGIVVAACLILN